ncbi:MAG: amylo-alpha-1,6-glucosidase [Chloroflexi bacterium]|nr:amylo-alpha-1,6-glucosidase [Chloroflexota bacterium]
MITIPREICRDLDQALSREWLVTNGIGGYASSSIAGANTRRYHGLLVAALDPPAARTVLLSKIDEEVLVDGSTYRLGTNEYESGTIYPDGYLFLDRVESDGMIPTLFYRAGGFSLSKTVWMEQGQNTTYVRYALDPSSKPIAITLLPLCTYRDFHSHVRGTLEWHFGVDRDGDDVLITAHPGAPALRLASSPAASFARLDLWYWRFRHRQDMERGLDSVEDLNLPGLMRAQLNPGESFTLTATTEPAERVERDVTAAFERARSRASKVVVGARDDFEAQLYSAADQFIVQRRVGAAALHTVIAGYHWFGDWGRDTMISLPGLALLTGRYEDAKDILQAFAQYVDKGMLPNRFPDAGLGAAPLEYNTVDATLWYFHAVDAYLQATGDQALLESLFATLDSIVDWHEKGTRYNIHVDPADGLLFSGAPGVQLTWMDAKAGNWVVTPRTGKPVEINALWYHALCLMEGWAARLGKSTDRYRDAAARVRTAFDSFWYAEGGYLYDVVDSPTPGANDASLRPNQLFALSLGRDLVTVDRAKSILDVVTRYLLTPFGLRSLSPHDPDYHSQYRGDQFHRDGAYHQGIVWTWLLGTYVDAYLQVYGDRAHARSLLEPLRAQFGDGGIGTLNEIFEGEPPYLPVGCIAQAWSVAEALRAWRASA